MNQHVRGQVSRHIGPATLQLACNPARPPGEARNSSAPTVAGAAGPRQCCTTEPAALIKGLDADFGIVSLLDAVPKSELSVCALVRAAMQFSLIAGHTSHWLSWQRSWLSHSTPRQQAVATDDGDGPAVSSRQGSAQYIEYSSNVINEVKGMEWSQVSPLPQ